MGEDDLLSDTVQPNQNSAMTRLRRISEMGRTCQGYTYHGDAKQASGSRR